MSININTDLVTAQNNALGIEKYLKCLSDEITEGDIAKLAAINAIIYPTAIITTTNDIVSGDAPVDVNISDKETVPAQSPG